MMLSVRYLIFTWRTFEGPPPMSRTQELVERLRNRFDPFENGPDELCRAAAARLAELDYDTEYLRRLMANIAELERENAALKSEVEFLHLRRGQLVIERDKAREALGDLVSWFTTPQVGGQVWMIPAGERGADGAVNAARAALAGSGEK